VGLLKKDGRKVCISDKNKGKKDKMSKKMQFDEIEELSILVEKKE
jgi:hypothetical protein